MATELGTSLWSDDLRVTVACVAPALAGVLDGDRVCVVGEAGPDLDDVLTEMANLAAAIRPAGGLNKPTGPTLPATTLGEDRNVARITDLDALFVTTSDRWRFPAI